MLNLIIDAWIPVQTRSGARRVIAPWQMTDPDLVQPAWPRADLNIACYELLIGMVALADPPLDDDDWRARRAGDPDRLRNKLAAYAEAFELMGDGPRFMQDFEALSGDANPIDMLFLDGSGGNTLKNNADVLVHRERYLALSAAEAAIALFTLQAHAPSGGAGNRTSMRGGGPMVTLVDPGAGLWSVVWANTPNGRAADLNELPWMKPTRVSTKGSLTEETYPDQCSPVEAFFGMPRRLRLVADEQSISGVVQHTYGNNYAGWRHPLTPYYRVKEGAELLPKHPKAGRFGYRNWLGIVEKARSETSTKERALMVDAWDGRSLGDACEVIVAGWAMDNMKPLDFIQSRAPLLNLSDDAELILEGMIEGAEAVGVALRGALKDVLANGEAREAVREAFFLDTEADFEALARRLTAEPAERIAAEWLDVLRRRALSAFEETAMPGFADRDLGKQAKIVEAQNALRAVLHGYTKQGQKLYGALMLEAPIPKKKRKAA